MREFQMPSMGADMDAGTLLEWRVAPGASVHRGDVLAVVDTDKSALEIEAFHDGVVDSLLVTEGTTVPVGTTLALLREAGDEAGDEPAATVTPPPAGTASEEPAATASEQPAVSTDVPDLGLTPDLPRPVAPSVEHPAPTAATARRVLAHPVGGQPTPGGVATVSSPLVRGLATRAHVDLDHVVGTGPGGVITRADVERAARRRPRVTPRARRLARRNHIDLTPLASADVVVTGEDVLAHRPRPVEQDRQVSMRRAIAAAMTRSAREIPHYHLAETIDMHAAMTWLGQHNADRPLTERVLPAALLLHAAAQAAHAVPESNGTYTEGTFAPAPTVNLGVAISLRGGGLVAPAVLEADTLDLDELMARLRDLIVRARRGGLRGREVTEGTITVTNLGDQGVGVVHGLIHPPQVALVGFGTITDRAVVVDGRVEARSTVVASLAGDHRVSDGLHGGRFLRHVRTLLEHPEETHDR